MRRSLTILLILFAAAAYTPLRAQSLDAFKERLAAPVASDAAFGTAKVAVTECGDAARAVNEASRAGARLRFPGYRAAASPSAAFLFELPQQLTIATAAITTTKEKIFFITSNV